MSGSRDPWVKDWDVASGQELLTLEGRHGWVFSVAFSLDGKRIVAGRNGALLCFSLFGYQKIG